MTTSTFVAFLDEELLIGEGAINQVSSIYDAKRLLGRRFSDPEVHEGLKSWPFKVIKGAYGFPKVVVAYKGKEKEYSAEEISSMILTKLKENVESYLGKFVKEVVITVPAYFNDSQRQAIEVAAHLAGLDALKIIHEPIAAALV